MRGPLLFVGVALYKEQPAASLPGYLPDRFFAGTGFSPVGSRSI
jgi:hypothetical protein